MSKVTLCMLCKHYRFLPDGSCNAYPHGVPEEVFLGKLDHRYPLPGDQGIHFEPTTTRALNALIAQREAEGVFADDSRLRRRYAEMANPSNQPTCPIEDLLAKGPLNPTGEEPE